MHASVALLALSLVGVSATATAQHVRGRVYDINTGIPIVSANVQIIDLVTRQVRTSVRTDTGGRFTIKAPKPGIYRVKYSRFGYAPSTSIPMSIVETDDAIVTVALKPDVALMEAITSTATAAMGGVYFEQRRASGLGKIFTKSDIEAQKYSDIASAFSEVPSASARQDPQSRKWLVALRPQMTGSSCAPAYYLNGSRLNGLRGEFAQDAADMIFGTPIDLVWALEVYASVASIPGIYAGQDMMCGVIALWTRRPG